jgi:hypothetical protein
LMVADGSCMSAVEVPLAYLPQLLDGGI